MQDGGKPVAIDSSAVSADKSVAVMGERTSPAMRRHFLFLFDLDFTAGQHRSALAERQNSSS